MLSVSYWTKSFRTFSPFPEEGLPFVEKVLSAAYSLLNVSSYLPNVSSINGNEHIQEIAIGLRYTHIEGASQDKKLSRSKKVSFPCPHDFCYQRHLPLPFLLWFSVSAF